jgi:hypothetical protein
VPGAARTTAPAILISIEGLVIADEVIAGAGALPVADETGVAVSATIGTNAGDPGADLAGPRALTSRRMLRRHPNTCCGRTCHLRATSETHAPGARLSATIPAFSASDQRRRRPGPVSNSIRR